MGNCEIEQEQKKIHILNIPLSELQSDHPHEARLYCYPERNLLSKKDADSLNRSTTDSNSEERQEITRFQVGGVETVKIGQKIYGYLSWLLLKQIGNIYIKEVLLDELIVDKLLYLTKHNSFIIRTFSDLEHKEYLNVLYQIHTYNKIAQLNCLYLHKIKNYLCIEPTNQLINHYSDIIFLQEVQTNLSLIINNRRAKKMVWTYQQFYQLMHNLVQAVATLHYAGYTHNDIRPSNVYYCQSKACFVLGSFFHTMPTSLPNHFAQQSKQTNFKSHYRQRKLSMAANTNHDPYKDDIYGLGMTLLCAFYLCQPVDRKKCAPHNRFLMNEYPFMKIIRGMVTSAQKRLTINQIKLQILQLQAIINPQEIFPKMAVYNVEELVQFVDVVKRERYISDAYKVLGLIQRWKQRLDNKHVHKTISEQSIETAKYYEQLAIISSIQKHTQKSKNYYIRSAQIYQKIGSINYKERDYQKSINYFRCGLQNFQIIQNKSCNVTYLKLLVSLYEASIISGYSLVDNDKLVNLQKLIIEIKDQQTFAYCSFLQQLANIYEYYQNYGKVNQILHRKLEIASLVSSKMTEITIKKLIIRNNIQIIMQKNQDAKIKNRLVTETQLQILTIFNDQEYYFIERPVQKLEMLFMHAKIKHIRGYLKQSIKRLQDLLNQLKQWMETIQQNVNSQEVNTFFSLKSQVLQYFGQIYLGQNQLQTSLVYYSQSLQNYRQYFGDVYNIESAHLLQKIGEINKIKNQYGIFSDCFGMVLKILKSQYGQYHKDILRFVHQNKKSRKLDFTLPSFKSFKTDTDISSMTDL